MYAWLIGRFIRLAYGQVVTGRPALVEAAAARDVEFVFPGHNSFAGTYRGKDELVAWLRRFASFDPSLHVRDVVVSGFPWNLRVAVWFDDTIGDDYRNEGVEYLRIRWGRLRQLRVYLDTERISAWEARHIEVAASA